MLCHSPRLSRALLATSRPVGRSILEKKRAAARKQNSRRAAGPREGICRGDGVAQARRRGRKNGPGESDLRRAAGPREGICRGKELPRKDQGLRRARSPRLRVHKPGGHRAAGTVVEKGKTQPPSRRSHPCNLHSPVPQLTQSPTCSKNCGTRIIFSLNKKCTSIPLYNSQHDTTPPPHSPSTCYPSRNHTSIPRCEANSKGRRCCARARMTIFFCAAYRSRAACRGSIGTPFVATPARKADAGARERERRYFFVLHIDHGPLAGGRLALPGR